MTGTSRRASPDASQNADSGAGKSASPRRPSDAPNQRRNRNFDETHRALIEKAVDMISRSGMEALSVSALARAAGMNRSTLYYHFDSREALIAAVTSWSSEQISRAFNPEGDSPDDDRGERMNHLTSFVLSHPEVIKLWIDDFIAPGDIRERYPRWDELVAGFVATFAEAFPDEQADAEVFSVFLLAGALIGPRIFHNSVRPEENIETVVARFTRETQRLLQHEGLRATWVGASRQEP